MISSRYPSPTGTDFWSHENNSPTEDESSVDGLSQYKVILVVEDDRFSQSLLTNIIDEHIENTKVVTAKSYSDAKKIIASNSPPLQLVILDIFLEGHKTGFDLLKWLETSIHPPKILISSVLERGRILQMTKQCQLDLSYINKPAHPEKYIAIIKSLIEE